MLVSIFMNHWPEPPITVSRLGWPIGMGIDNFQRLTFTTEAGGSMTSPYNFY